MSITDSSGLLANPCCAGDGNDGPWHLVLLPVYPEGCHSVDKLVGTSISVQHSVQVFPLLTRVVVALGDPLCSVVETSD